MGRVTNKVIPQPHQHTVRRVYAIFVDIDDVCVAD